MENKKKLDILEGELVNISVTNYQHPRLVDTPYGTSYLFDIVHNGEEKVWFLSEKQYVKFKDDLVKFAGLITVKKEKLPGFNWPMLSIMDGLNKLNQNSTEKQQSNNHPFQTKPSNNSFSKIQASNINYLTNEQGMKWGNSLNMASRVVSAMIAGNINKYAELDWEALVVMIEADILDFAKDFYKLEPPK
jgi:hypothetical protein